MIGNLCKLMIIISLTCLICIPCAEIVVYEHPHGKGKSFTLTMDYSNKKCQNLPEEWTHKVSSVNTGNLCLKLYPQRNCNGDHITVYPGTDHSNLVLWDFNDILESIVVCDEHIAFDSEKGNTIRIHYNHSDTNRCAKQNGKVLCDARLFMTVDNCKNVPEDVVGNIFEIHTFHSCYDFFQSKNCMGKQVIAQFRDDQTRMKLVESVQRCDKRSATVVGSSNTTVIYIITVLVIVTFIIFLITGIFLHKRTKRKYYSKIVELELQNEKFIEDFMNGNPKAFDLISYDKADAIYRATNTPYDSETFDIPLDSLKMDNQTLLGTGAFGMVVKAELSSTKFSHPFDVAVKIVKPGVETTYVKTLLDECKIMMYLHSSEKHGHIVNLVGVCTENLSKLEPYIVIEYCSNGSLDKYLKEKRKHFENFVRDGCIVYPETQWKEDTNSINTLHLMKWSKEIADGMTYLSNKKVIHGDLAARNILLDIHFKAKISDFGFSRHLYQYSQYVKKKEAPLPWKWMAIECIEDMTFSTQSDVWAFGVTLWEIFTLVRTPYPGTTWNPQFLKSLKDGLRLTQPKYAPLFVYELMLKCWEENRDARPSFDELRIQLSTVDYKGNE